MTTAYNLKWHVFYTSALLSMLILPINIASDLHETRDAIKAMRKALKHAGEKYSSKISVESIENGWQVTFYRTRGIGRAIMLSDGREIYRFRKIIYLDENFDYIKSDSTWGTQAAELTNMEINQIFSATEKALISEEARVYLSSCKNEYEKSGKVVFKPVEVNILEDYPDLMMVKSVIVKETEELAFLYDRCGCGSVPTWGCFVWIYLKRDDLSLQAVTFD